MMRLRISAGSLILCFFCFGIAEIPGAQAAPPKTLVLALSGEPKTFNVLLAQEATSSEVARFIFEGLTRLNPLTGEIQGGLAESWKSDAAGLQWTFSLRPNVRWSDGRDLTAEDVVFTFRVIQDTSSIIPARDIFTLNKKPILVEALDTLTVRFTLPEPFAPFLLALGQPILPQHKLAAAWGEGRFSKAWSLSEDPRQIIGTGPFVLKQYQPGQKVILEKNKIYWKRDLRGDPLPRLDEVILMILPSAEVKLLKFLEGSLDAYMMSGRDYPVLKPLESRRNFKIVKSGLGLGSNFLAFNQNSKDKEKAAWFKRTPFRAAAASALDRQSLLNIVFQGLGGLQCSPVSPSIPFFYHAGAECFEYDPRHAKRILRDEGFEDRDGDGFLEDRNGRTLEFVLTTNAENSERVEMAQMIREDLTRVGMKVSLLILEFNSLVSKLLGSGDWDAVLMGFTGTADPHFGSAVWKTQGSLHFWEARDPSLVSGGQTRIDQIFSEASGLAHRDQRKALYDEWQAITAREVPLIYTILPETMGAVSGRLLNVQPSVLGGFFHNAEEIDKASA